MYRNRNYGVEYERTLNDILVLFDLLKYHLAYVSIYTCLEASPGAQSVTVKPTVCGFDPHCGVEDRRGVEFCQELVSCTH